MKKEPRDLRTLKEVAGAILRAPPDEQLSVWLAGNGLGASDLAELLEIKPPTLAKFRKRAKDPSSGREGRAMPRRLAERLKELSGIEWDPVSET